MRKTIYVSERRNKPIADFIKGLPAQDVSYEIVKLMEDGMKWRESGNNVKEAVEKGSNGKVLFYEAPLPTVETKVDFSDIKLQKKQVDKETLDKKFNNI